MGHGYGLYFERIGVVGYFLEVHYCLYCIGDDGFGLSLVEWLLLMRVPCGVNRLYMFVMLLHLKKISTAIIVSKFAKFVLPTLLGTSRNSYLSPGLRRPERFRPKDCCIQWITTWLRTTATGH